MSVLTALTAIAMAAILLLLIQGISNGANELDDAKSTQAIRATLSGTLEQVSALVTDNAKWDDAVTHTYGDTDSQWLFDTWGYSTADRNYDVAFIIDETGKTVAGFSNGEVLNTGASAFFGPAFDRLAASLPKDNKTFAVATSFLKTPKGIAAVAVAPILPNTEGVSIPSERPRLLVFSKTLTPEYLAALGDRLAVKGLKIVPDHTEPTPFMPLAGTDGSFVGYMTWIPDRPGDAAKSAIQAPALLAIAGMIACMIFLTGFSGRLSSRLQRSESQAWAIAHRDTLTSLPNRLAATTRLDAKLNDPGHGVNGDVTVILADLDGFKEVNDTYGHQVGDQLLKGVAAGLEIIAAKFSASLSRLGGDEFAVIIDGEHSRRRAEDISRASLDFLADPFDLDGRVVRIGMSIGIATSSDLAVSSSELMRRADVAMYTAKERGKNQYCEYQPDLDVLRNSRIAMAAQLEKALAAHRIEVAFQPIVDAKSHRISGVEALARWQQPVGQWVPPDVFIKVAEEFGQIDELGNQVLTFACREAASWHDINLSVNISPAQFRNPAFVDNVLAIVDHSGLPRGRLELEVTEGYLIEHQDRARPIIEKLRAAGIHVSLDDFGTGYSSIGYLRQYHFDKLKIDKSLIRGMIDDSSARSIIQAATVLARSMNMTVTAEGVEHEEEASLLRLAGCDTLQGFYFGRPQSAQSIAALIAAQQTTQAVA